VFIPLLLMGGLIGRLFREFAVTVSVAILMSGLVSLTLTPMMCGQLLSQPGPGKRDSRLASALEAIYQRSLDLYAVCLRWSLRHRLFMMAIMAGTLPPPGFFYPLFSQGAFLHPHNHLVHLPTPDPP